MQLTLLQAHATCLGLVALDLGARTLRLRLLLGGVGSPLGWRDSFRVNVFAEAGATLTPMRLGGEPARLAGMLAARVPATAAFVAIAYEVLTAWPVLLAIAITVAIRHAPAWWATAAPVLAANVREAWPWALGVVGASFGAWLAARRLAHVLPRRVSRPLRRVSVYWRRMPRGPLLASIPLSAVNVLSRVAILPVLASTVPNPPPFGVLLVGSFALVYSQLVLPTPAGAGVVEFGFLGGAAGDLGRGAGLLLAWRFYSSGIGTALGVGLALRHYGFPVLRDLLGRVVGRRVPVPARPGAGGGEEVC